MADSLINRAHLLMQQRRYDEAARVLKDLLGNDPDNVHILAMFAQVKLQQHNVKEAEDLIDSAIGLSPDTDYLYYVKAGVALKNKKYDDAENSLHEAIALNPADSDYFGLLASVKLMRKEYAKSLELANKALELDPENIQALNTRSSSLLKLNRKEESFNTIEGALAYDPGNAYTHSNYGWGLLEKGDHRKALEHFREALKNNPNLQHAQTGMAEALKAKYLLYRLFLKYAFFMGNLTAKYQWGVIIGFYLATRLLKELAKINETLGSWLLPLMIILGIIAFSTWVITPLSNLFFRLNPYGKYLLDKEEKVSAAFVGVSLLLCLTGVICYLLLSNETWLLLAGFGFFMMVPLGSMCTLPAHRNKMVAYCIALFLLGAVGIFQAFNTGEPLNLFTTLFIIGFIAYQWIANFLNIRRSNA